MHAILENADQYAGGIFAMVTNKNIAFKSTISSIDTDCLHSQLLGNISEALDWQ